MPKLYKPKPHPHAVPSQLHSRVSLRNSIDNHITKAHTCVHVAWTFTLLTNNTPCSFSISLLPHAKHLFFVTFLKIIKIIKKWKLKIIATTKQNERTASAFVFLWM